MNYLYFLFIILIFFVSEYNTNLFAKENENFKTLQDSGRFVPMLSIDPKKTPATQVPTSSFDSIESTLIDIRQKLCPLNRGGHFEMTYKIAGSFSIKNIISGSGDSELKMHILCER